MYSLHLVPPSSLHYLLSTLTSTILPALTTFHLPSSILHPPPSALHPPPSTFHHPASILHRPLSTLRPPPSSLHLPPATLPSQAFRTLWYSSKHNMGFGMNRATWNRVKTCVREFCTFDDYNWDWSLCSLSKHCLQPPLQVLVSGAPRVFHIGTW